MSVELKPHSVIKARLKVNNKGPVQAFLTATCAKAMENYVPFDTGTLSETVILGGKPTTNVTETTITYAQPYANYVYKGISKNGNELHYHTDKHKGAGPYWDKRMISGEGKRVVRDVQRFIERGGDK